MIDDNPVNIPSLPSTVPTISISHLSTTTQTLKTIQPTTLQSQEPALTPRPPAPEHEITNKKSTTTMQPIYSTTQHLSQNPIRTSTQQTETTKQQIVSKATQKPTTKPKQPKTTTTLKPAKTTKATNKFSNTTKTHSTTKPPSTSSKPTTKITQTTPTTKMPATTLKSIVTTNKKPITTAKPTVTTTNKLNIANQPPTEPKSPQTQSPLLPLIKMTPTETSSTINDQLVAKSNFVERSEFATIPRIVMTTSQSLLPSTFGNVLKSNEVPNIQNSADYVAYALLPNNTLVRRVSPRSTIQPTEIPFVVYGLYPNGTIVKRYPNGTVVPDDPSPETNELIGEVDPLNKQGLSEIVERDRSLAYLYPSTTTSTKHMV